MGATRVNLLFCGVTLLALIFVLIRLAWNPFWEFVWDVVESLQPKTPAEPRQFCILWHNWNKWADFAQAEIRNVRTDATQPVLIQERRCTRCNHCQRRVVDNFQ